MTARVVASWIAGETEGRGSDAGGHRDWRVWVETTDGSYVLVGTFSGTEGEAVAAALDATGAETGFALAAECETLYETATRPRDEQASSGAREVTP